MEPTFEEFENFDPGTDDESTDEEELLEAYTHTQRAYSHGVTLDRYVNSGSRQLTMREFARVITGRIMYVYNNGLSLVNITLQYKTSTNDNRYRTITVQELSNHPDLTSVITSDNSFFVLTSGSDKQNNEDGVEYYLSSSYFEVTTIGHSGGSVKTITMGTFAKLLNTSYDDNDCVFDCISYITKHEFNINKVRKFLCVRKFANILAEHVPTIARIARTTACVYEDMVEYNVDNSGDIKIEGLKLISGDANAKIKLVLKNNHYYVLVSEYDVETQMYELHRLVDTKEIMDPELSKRDDCIYMFFDYETVISSDTQEAIPYCFSYLIYDTSDGSIIRNVVLRTTDHEDDVSAFYDNIRQVFSGIGANKKCRKYMIGYNNSGFDNFLLVRQAMHSNIPVRNVLVDSGNRLLTMVYSHFKVFDLYRVLGTSLDKACKSFGIKNGKLKLDHHEVQDAAYRGKLEEYIAREEVKITEYSLRDVECLFELFLKVKNVVYEQTTTDREEGLILEDELTTASMTYKAFKNTLTDDVFKKIPILSLKLDDIIRKAVIGGRTQIFVKGEYKGKVRCIDVTSLYPYIMMFREFPLDDPIYTKCFMDGKIGVYHVTIHKQPEDKIIPLREKDSLNWEYGGVIETWVTQEDIRIMEKFGCSFAIIEGYYWKESSKDIFKPYMGNLMEMKMEQDRFKEEKEKLEKEGKTEEAAKIPYNPVLREMLKLWLNALSGKVIQRVFTEEKRFCFNNDEVERCLSSIGTLKAVTSVGDVTLISAKVKNPSVKVPSIWGVLIYSYARSYMYENFISQSKTKLAMDTDSLFLSEEEYEEFVKNMPELFGVGPGQMKEELGKDKYGIYKAKKFYIIFMKEQGENGVEKCVPFKVKWKGVKDKDRVITDKNIIKLIDDDELSQHQLFNLYYFWSNGLFSKGGEEHDIKHNPNIPFVFRRKTDEGYITIPLGSQREGDELMPMGLEAYNVDNFRNLCKGHEVRVLCNQLRKNIMNENLCKLSINDVFIFKKFK